MKLHRLLPGPAGAWEPIPADKVVAGAPATRTWVQYEDAEARLSAGLWEASVGKWRIAYSEWEYVVMVSGHCVVAGDDGSVIEAGPGDSFVIEPGFTGTWEVTETMAKRWVIKE
jgi:uncharacterized cupin superfamily protein